jgi:hypothetical protein
VNNFGSETASIVGAKSCGKTLAASCDSLVMMKVKEEKSLFFVIVYRVYDVNKMMIPMIFIVVWNPCYEAYFRYQFHNIFLINK